VGGIVGYASSNQSNISNSYNLGTITGSNATGGIVGLNGGAVTTSYNSGYISGTTSTGGLIGSNTGAGTSSNSYWDTQTSGQATSASGTGKTLAQMQTQSQFSGFDFASTWGIIQNYSYPYLLAFYPNPNLPRAISGFTPGGSASATGLAGTTVQM